MNRYYIYLYLLELNSVTAGRSRTKFSLIFRERRSEGRAEQGLIKAQKMATAVLTALVPVLCFDDFVVRERNTVICVRIHGEAERTCGRSPVMLGEVSKIVYPVAWISPMCLPGGYLVNSSPRKTLTIAYVQHSP